MQRVFVQSPAQGFVEKVTPEQAQQLARVGWKRISEPAYKRLSIPQR